MGVVVTAVELERDVGAALAAATPFAPAATARASAALGLILESWQSTADGVHRGRLTADGFPVELVFSSVDPSVRYTCDVAGPALAPACRLDRATRLLRDLGVAAAFPLEHLQREGRQRWGAWLAGRHTSSNDAYKLYIEAPDPLSTAARNEAGDRLGRYRTLATSHEIALRLVGFDTSSGDLEFYFRTRDLDAPALSRLMRFAGADARGRELFTLIDSMRVAGAAPRLPGTRQGFSLRIGPDGAATDFTFFLFATSLFGSDAAARRTLLDVAGRRGWDLSMYAAVSAPLAARVDPRPHHGLVSFVARADDAVSIAIGLRPPEPQVTPAAP